VSGTAVSNANSRTRRVADLAAGEEFHSGTYEVTREGIRQFAAEFDPQAFHLMDDPKSFFGEQVASGWHTAAITMRLFVEALPLAGGRVGAGVDGLKWPAPVRPGDTLQVKATVKDVKASRSKPGTYILTVLVETSNQSGQLVQTMTPTVVVREPGEKPS
jgi:acyl dehydratase